MDSKQRFVLLIVGFVCLTAYGLQCNVSMERVWKEKTKQAELNNATALYMADIDSQSFYSPVPSRRETILR